MIKRWWCKMFGHRLILFAGMVHATTVCKRCNATTIKPAYQINSLNCDVVYMDEFVGGDQTNGGYDENH